MIFRAVFWIGLVSLLTPHEPDLGLGRPGAGTLHPSPTALLSSAASGLSQQGTACGTQCAGGLGLLSIFHLNNSTVTAGLMDVKAQIEADKKARAGRGAI